MQTTTHSIDISALGRDKRSLSLANEQVAIEVPDLSLFYGQKQALHNVSMNIPRQRVTAFIGPSGCGKTTFLRSINRMHEVLPGATVDGQLLLDGEDIYGPGVDPVRVRSQIGMVFQRPNPFPTMSIRDNVLAGYKLNGTRLNKSRADELVEKSLRGANLWNEVKDRLDKPGSGLSGGQQQRLCIARSIAVQPDVILMDEPCSALDPISTLAVEDLINELKEEYTVIIVTHNMQQAARVADKTAFFNIQGVGKPGKLIEYDDTNVIFNNPSSQQTEDYVSGRFGCAAPRSVPDPVRPHAGRGRGVCGAGRRRRARPQASGRRASVPRRPRRAQATGVSSHQPTTRSTVGQRTDA